jgi:hypothetical protein
MESESREDERTVWPRCRKTATPSLVSVHYLLSTLRGWQSQRSELQTGRRQRSTKNRTELTCGGAIGWSLREVGVFGIEPCRLASGSTLGIPIGERG